MSASVKDLRNGLESILASGVPNLQFEDLFFAFDQERAKFDAYCNIMVILKIIFDKPIQNARLSYAWVSDNDQFE